MTQITSGSNDTNKDSPIKSPSESNSEEKPTRDFSLYLKVATELAPKIIALGLTAIYLSGYLVLNTHLNRYGIVAPDLINVRYLVAGAVFTFYLLCFGVFAGRSVFSGKNWLSNEIQHLTKSGAHPAWGLISFIHTFVQAAFFLCLSAALFSSWALSQSETSTFYGVLIAVFVFDYFLDTTNLDVKFPVFYLLFQIIYKVTAIWVFFHLQESIKLTVVFMSYMAIYFYINLVLDRIDRYKITTGHLGYSIIFSLIFVLVSAISFGSLFFGDVSRKIGGGKPIQATVGFSKKAVDSLSSELEFNSNSIEANILLMVNDFIFVETKGKTIRINENQVDWIELHRPEDNAVPKAVEQKIEEKINGNKPGSDKDQNKEAEHLTKG